MRTTGMSPIASRAALLAALVLAGCAAPPPAAIRPGVKVVPVEQSAWNAAPEPGLYRIAWDAERVREIREKVRFNAAPEGLEPYTAERLQVDEEGDRELKARGLCTNGTARLVVLLDDGRGPAGLSGIFKCRLSAF